MGFVKKKLLSHIILQKAKNCFQRTYKSYQLYVMFSHSLNGGWSMTSHSTVYILNSCKREYPNHIHGVKKVIDDILKTSFLQEVKLQLISAEWSECLLT